MRMAVKDHRLTVKAYDYLIVEDAGEAWRVQVHETSKAVAGVAPETISILYIHDDLHLQRDATVRVKTVYNKLPLARELVALHEFVLS